MAGFYVHIPFCRQACRYCDFHFSVSLRFKPDIIEAMLKEIILKKDDFARFKFETLYFGGGTPSVLDGEELQKLKDSILHNFDFIENFEFTLEANPDDLSSGYLKDLKALGVNRLSIGVQSFVDRDLVIMRRSHNAKQARNAVTIAQDQGIDNINVDLIYGFPEQDISEWEANLEKTFTLNVPHISAYHLTFETGTVFDLWRKKGRISPVTDKSSIDQFRMLKKKTRDSGFEHYEISNFARPGFRSRHNMIYWKNTPYLGIGPSAHSYDGNRRFWNISNNKRYIEFLMEGSNKFFEYEELSVKNQYNEYVLTGLRTIWGIDLDEIQIRFGDNYVKYTLKIFEGEKKKELLTLKGKKLTLSTKGIFLADQVIREFFRI